MNDEKPREDPYMNISRVPKNTLHRFLEIANEADFCGDRGMALKYLIDFHDGLLLTGTEGIEKELESLRKDVEELKSSQNNETENEKTPRVNIRGETKR